MHFRAEIDIERGIDEVVSLFEKPENTLKWLEGLRSIELISGNAGEVGTISKVTFESALGRMEITEIIKVNNLPEEYATTYDGIGYFSWSRHHFIPVNENRTKYVSTQDVELHGALKAASFFLRGAVKKQLRKSLASFKEFAEAASSENQ